MLSGITKAQESRR